MDLNRAIDEVFEPEQNQGLKRKDVQSSAWAKAFGYKPVSMLGAIDEVYGRESKKESPGMIRSAGRGLVHGTLGLAETAGTALEYFGHRLDSEGMVKAGKTAKEYWHKKAEPFGPPEEIANKNVWDNPELLKNASWWSYNVSDMLPAFVAMMVPAVGVEAAMVKIGTRMVPFTTKAAERIFTLGRRVAVLGTGGLTGGGIEGMQTYNQVLEKGGSEKEAARAAEFMTIGAGFLNSIGISKVLAKAGTGFKAKVIKTLGAGFWEGLTEGAEEPTEVISKVLAGYVEGKPIPEDLEQQLVDSLKDALTVAPVAGVTGVGGSIFHDIGMKRNTQDPVKKQEISDDIKIQKKKAVKEIQDEIIADEMLPEKEKIKPVKEPIPMEEPVRDMADKMLDEEVKKSAEVEEQKAFHEGDILKTAEAKETVNRAVKALKKAKVAAGKSGSWLEHNALKENIRKARLPNTENRKKSLEYLWKTYAPELPEPAELRTHYKPEEPREKEDARKVRKPKKKIPKTGTTVKEGEGDGREDIQQSEKAQPSASDEEKAQEAGYETLEIIEAGKDRYIKQGGKWFNASGIEVPYSQIEKRLKKIKKPIELTEEVKAEKPKAEPRELKKDLIKKYEAGWDVKTEDDQGTWYDMVEHFENVRKENQPKIDALNDEFKPLKSKRDKESVARKKEIKAEIKRLRAEPDNLKAQYEDKVINYQISLQEEAEDIARKAGVPDDKIENFIEDLSLELSGQPMYAERNYGRTKRDILDELIDEYREETPTPKEQPQEAKKEPWEMTQDEFVKRRPLPQKGIFDSKNPPKGREGYNISAIKLDDGTIYFDTEARIHADMLDSLKIPPERIKEGGFIVNGEYKQGGADSARIGMQNLAKQKVKHRLAVDKALSENKPVPKEVLKDYPELKPTPPPEVTKKAHEGEGVIDKIIDASKKPLPKIVEVFELEGTDGKWHSGGFMPTGVSSTGERRHAGYVFQDRNGTRYGKRAKSKQELIDRHNAYEDKKAQDFKNELLKMSPERLQSQTDFWLKKKAKTLVDEVSTTKERKVDTDEERLSKYKKKRFKTANDERMIEVLKKRIKADPSKWKVGDGVGWRVNYRQINRGYRIIEVIPESKKAIIKPVSDTGLTIDGSDRMPTKSERVHIADLVRDRKYNKKELEKPQPIGKAWVKQQQKPIMSAREIKRGKDKGKVEVTLTKGRDAEGNPRPGRKVKIDKDAVIEWPGAESKPETKKEKYQIGKSIPLIGNEPLIDTLRKSPLKNLTMGLSNDGSVWVRNKNGKGFQVKSVKFIKPDRAALELGHGRMLKDGEFIKGKYQDGVIELQRDLADKWSVVHESIHMAEDMGFISPTEVATLRGHIKRLERNKKWDSEGREVGGSEDRAIFATEFMKGREAKGAVGRVLQKIADFFDMILNVFNRTAKGILRDIESGKVFERDTGKPQTRVPEYEKTAQRWYSQMTNVLSQKLPGKGTPESYASTIEGFARKGEFKAEELSWSGVLDWLKEQKGKLTKQDVLNYMAENNVQLQEVEKTSGIPELEWKDAVKGGKYTVSTNNKFKIEHLPNGKFLLHSPGGLQRLTNDIQEAKDIAEQRNYNMGQPETKFRQYVLPGGTAYRELLLTLPKRELPNQARRNELRAKASEIAQRGIRENRDLTPEENAEYQRVQDEIRNLRQEDYSIAGTGKHQLYTSSHWEEPNVLAHVRFDERTGPNGEKILHISEIQSDWHQEGRKKGYENKQLQIEYQKVADERHNFAEKMREKYKDNAPYYLLSESDRLKWDELYNKADEIAKNIGIVPDAPFKKTWPLLTIKRMVRFASENGFDAISWDTGEVQADRYDLSKQVDRITARKNDDGSYDLKIYPKGQTLIEKSPKTENELSDLIGKELAEKISNQTSGAMKDYEGIDLKVGGEGMKGFYDKMLPNEVNKFFNKKAWGKAKVGKVSLPGTPLELPKGWSVEKSKSGIWSVYDEDRYVNGVADTKEQAIKVALESIGKPVHSQNIAHSLPITPQMKSKALSEGMPLFEISTVAEPELRKSTNRFIQKGRLNKKAFFNRTSIDLPSSDPKDLIKGFRWFQTMQDMAKNFPNMRKLFEVEKQRVSDSNFASMQDRETTEPYFTLKKDSREKVNEALLSGDENSEVYTDDQLKNEFKLTDEEIAGYQAIRDVLEEKLDEHIIRILSDVIDQKRTPIDRNIVEDIKKAKDEDELADVLTAHYVSEYEAKKLPWLVNWIKEFKGYIPHQWNSDWLVKVELGADEYMFEVPAIGGKIRTTRKGREKSAKRVAVEVIKEKLSLSDDQIRKLAKDKKILVVRSRDLPIDLFEGARMDVIQSIINDAQDKMWHETVQHMDKEQAEEFKDMQKVLRGHIEEMYLAKGWGRHLMGRRGVKGYRTDLESVISSYLIGANKFKAKGEAAKGFSNVMKDISPTKTPEQWKHGKQYVSDMLGESSEAGWFKKIAGTWFLAGDVSAAALNMTQNWTHAVPMLRSIKPKTNRMIAEKEIFLAMKDIAGEYAKTRGKDKKLFTEPSDFINKDEINALRSAYGEGHLDPAFLGETTGYHKNKVWQDYSQKTFGLMFKLFTGAEGWNRTSTFLAAYRRAKRSGMTDRLAIDKAVEIVEAAHFTYGRGNRPQAVRATGAVGNVMYTFMTYPLNNLVFLKHRTEDLLNDLHKGNKEAVKKDMKILGSNLGYVFAFGGLMGLPFSYLAQSVLNLFDDDEEDWEVLMRKHMPKTLGRMVTRGIPAAFLGNDMSWRVQGTDVVGMPIGFQIAEMGKKRIEKAHKLWQQGDETAAFFHLMPDMLKNPYRAVVGFKEGGTRTGVPPIKYTTGEAITKALSFTPTREAEAWKASDVTRKARLVRLENLGNFAERYLVARKRKDRKAVIELRNDLRDYNKRQKKKDRKGLRISWKDVTKSAKLRRKSRGKSYREKSPKYMREYQKDIEMAMGM